MKSKSTQLKRSGEIEKNKEKKRGRMQRKNLPYMTRSNKMTKTRRWIQKQKKCTQNDKDKKMNPKKQKKCTQSDKDKKMNPKKQRKYTQNDKQKENKLFENN